MKRRTLGRLEVKQLLTYSRVQSEANKERVRWPGPENLKLLAEAVAEKKPFVLFDGDRFRIRYNTHFGGTVFVKPDSQDYRPCGYFSVKELKDA